jgi:hypothetical protein
MWSNSVKHGDLLDTKKFLLVDHFLDSMSTIIQAHVHDFRMGSVKKKNNMYKIDSSMIK